MIHDATPEPRTDTPTVPKPYTAPTLTPLGSVEVVTAGPESGNLDQLYGGSGGFITDTTS